MKVTTYDKGSKTRLILAALVTNKTVLGAVADRWDKTGLFDTRWENLVAGWCVAHYRKYRKAPGRQIETIFDRWTESREGRDKDAVAGVGKFLAALSAEYARGGKVQVEYVVDLAGEYFTAVRAKQLRDQLDGLLEDGKVSDAVAAVRKFEEVSVGGSGGCILVGGDAGAVRKAFEEDTEPLVKYPGAAGAFFAHHLQRDAFISFVGPEKRSKSFHLQDVAWRAWTQGRNVAFFAVGDMSQNQMLRRFGARAAKRPVKATKPGEPVRLPTSLTPGRDDKDRPTVTFQEQTFDTDLSADAAAAALARVGKRHRVAPLRMWTYPNNSVTVLGLNAVLQAEKRRGWAADVVVIDYADLLAPIDGKVESRDQINATWKELRALSQSMHCLVVTATQANAASYSTDTLGMDNFSEDKRKNAHVTGMVGLNQTDEDKKEGLMRLNWVLLREGEFSRDQCLWTAPCLGLANPMVFSVFNGG